MTDFDSFRKKWDSCFEASEEQRRRILSGMTDAELNHFADYPIGCDGKLIVTREEVINLHLEFFARETGELEEDDFDMDF